MIIPKTLKLIITIKWYKNDNGGDRRCLCIDYTDEEDKKIKVNKVLRDFRTLPMDIGKNKGRIPYSVTTTSPNWINNIFQ